MGKKRSAGKGKVQEKSRRRFGSRAISFTREVRGELRRVNWPDRDQLQQSTAVVLVIVLTLAVFVAFWDYIFDYLAKLVFL
jgi:preprotein translocase subunit SecE